jgi:hypothetical protein
VCQPKKANGATCSLNSECASNGCINGSCCTVTGAAQCCEGSTTGPCGGVFSDCTVRGVRTCTGGVLGACSVVDAPVCCPSGKFCAKNALLTCFPDGSDFDHVNFTTCPNACVLDAAGMGSCT